MATLVSAECQFVGHLPTRSIGSKVILLLESRSQKHPVRTKMRTATTASAQMSTSCHTPYDDRSNLNCKKEITADCGRVELVAPLLAARPKVICPRRWRIK